MSEPDVQNVNRGYELYITITVFTVAIVLTTTARVIIKLYFRYRLGIDDWFIILCTILNLVASGLDCKAITSGFGRHAQFLTVDQQVDAVKYAQLAVSVSNWAIWAVKLSVCFFLLSLVRDIYPYYNWAVYILIAITTITALIGSVLWGTQAHPLAKLWDPRIPGTRASPEHFLVIVYVVYAFGCFTDIFYALSPLYFLWSTRLDWRKKLPIILLTGCGILVLIVGILNIIFAHDFLQQEDITWALIDEFICDVIERNFSAFVANLPALWLLVVQLRKRSTSSRNNNNSNNSGSTLPYYYTQNNVKNKIALDDTLSSTITDNTGETTISSQQELYQFHSGRHLLPPIISESDTNIINFEEEQVEPSTAESIALTTTQTSTTPIITSEEEASSGTRFTETQSSSNWTNHDIDNSMNIYSSGEIRVQTDVQVREEHSASLVQNSSNNSKTEDITNAGDVA